MEIICPPGPDGGVMTGRLDEPIDPAHKVIFWEGRGANRTLVEVDRKAARVPAARLWSCYLRRSGDTPVDSWQVQLVTAGVEPSQVPVEGDQVHDGDTARASSLTITRVPDRDGPVFAGRVASRDGAIYAYAWVHDTNPLGASGWAPVQRSPVDRDRDHGTWEVVAPGGLQYAVLHVSGEFDAFSVVESGALWTDGVLAAAFNGGIEIVRLPRLNGTVAGVVTGMGAVYDAMDPFDPLLIHAWSQEPGKRSNPIEQQLTEWKWIGRVECAASGYFSLAELRLPRRRHIELTLAVTTARFVHTKTPPVEVGGQVIALKSVRVSQS